VNTSNICKPIRILGIDPGTAIMGWGIVDQSGPDIKPVRFGCITSDKTVSRDDRLFAIFETLGQVMRDFQPTECAIEELFFFKNQKTIISVAEARGVAILAMRNFGLHPHEYTPLQIKQALTGYGRAEKSQIQEMVRLICDLKECPKPDDAADALAVAICHGQTNRQLAS